MPNYHLRIQSAFPSLAQEMQAYLESVLSGNLFVLDEKMVRSPSTSPGEIVGSGYLQAKFSGIQANTKKEVHKVDPEQIALLANDILKINARLWMDVIFLKAFRAEFYRDKNARPAIYQNFLQHLLHMHLYIDEEPNIIIQYVNGLIHDYTFLSGKSDILMQWKEWLVAELYAASDTALQKQLGICNSLCSNIQMLDEEEKIILLKKLIFLMQNLQEENLACPIFEIYQFLSPKLKKALVKALKKLQEEKNENAKLTITNIIHHDTCDHGANGFELASMLMGQSAKLDAKFNVLYQDIMSHRISAAFTRIMENFAHFAEQNGELELVDDPYIQSESSRHRHFCGALLTLLPHFQDGQKQALYSKVIGYFAFDVVLREFHHWLNHLYKDLRQKQLEELIDKLFEFINTPTDTVTFNNALIALHTIAVTTSDRQREIISKKMFVILISCMQGIEAKSDDRSPHYALMILLEVAPVFTDKQQKYLLSYIAKSLRSENVEDNVMACKMINLLPSLPLPIEGRKELIQQFLKFLYTTNHTAAWQALTELLTWFKRDEWELVKENFSTHLHKNPILLDDLHVISACLVLTYQDAFVAERMNLIFLLLNKAPYKKSYDDVYLAMLRKLIPECTSEERVIISDFVAQHYNNEHLPMRTLRHYFKIGVPEVVEEVSFPFSLISTLAINVNPRERADLIKKAKQKKAEMKKAGEIFAEIFSAYEASDTETIQFHFSKLSLDAKQHSNVPPPKLVLSRQKCKELFLKHIGEFSGDSKKNSLADMMDVMESRQISVTKPFSMGRLKTKIFADIKTHFQNSDELKLYQARVSCLQQVDAAREKIAEVNKRYLHALAGCDAAMQFVSKDSENPALTKHIGSLSDTYGKILRLKFLLSELETNCLAIPDLTQATHEQIAENEKILNQMVAESRDAVVTLDRLMTAFNNANERMQAIQSKSNGKAKDRMPLKVEEPRPESAMSASLTTAVMQQRLIATPPLVLGLIVTSSSSTSSPSSSKTPSPEASLPVVPLYDPLHSIPERVINRRGEREQEQHENAQPLAWDENTRRLLEQAQKHAMCLHEAGQCLNNPTAPAEDKDIALHVAIDAFSMFYAVLEQLALHEVLKPLINLDELKVIRHALRHTAHCFLYAADNDAARKALVQCCSHVGEYMLPLIEHLIHGKHYYPHRLIATMLTLNSICRDLLAHQKERELSAELKGGALEQEIDFLRHIHKRCIANDKPELNYYYQRAVCGAAAVLGKFGHALRTQEDNYAYYREHISGVELFNHTKINPFTNNFQYTANVLKVLGFGVDKRVIINNGLLPTMLSMPLADMDTLFTAMTMHDFLLLCREIRNIRGHEVDNRLDDIDFLVTKKLAACASYHKHSAGSYMSPTLD